MFFQTKAKFVLNTALMASILSIAVLIQLCAVCQCAKPVYQRALFPYSRCYQFPDDSVECKPLNITKDARQEKLSQWPPGPYAVLVANDQCPEPDSSGWKKGVVSLQVSNQAEYLTLYFCVKTKRYSEADIDRGKWMSGTYSIYMSGLTCPDGFEGLNQTVVYESFNHSGNVPNFTTIDDSEKGEPHIRNKVYKTAPTQPKGRKSIVLYMCQHNSTDITLKDDAEFDNTYTEFLRETFVSNGSDNDSYSKVLGELELDSEFIFSKKELYLNNFTEFGVVWYKFDFLRALPLKRILIKHNITLEEVTFEERDYSIIFLIGGDKETCSVKGMYKGCTWSNVKWDLSPSDEESCNETVYINDYFISLEMSLNKARFITLAFQRTDSIERLEKMVGHRSKEERHINSELKPLVEKYEYELERHKRLWNLQSNLFKIFLLDLPSADICNEDLGMKDGSIQNFQIKASSWLHKHVPSKSRPLSDGWCADQSDSKPWILVDLIAVTRVEGLTVGTGKPNNDSLQIHSASCWTLNLFHGKQIYTLTIYKGINISVQSSLLSKGKTFMLLKPLDARYVKLEPEKCEDHSPRLCLRFELHGCKLSGLPNLNCSEESDMFELDRGLRPEGNPVIYTHQNIQENCSALCYRRDNCSVVQYTNCSNERCCSLYQPSLYGMWQTSNMSTETWFAKMCEKEHVKLFPRLAMLDEEEEELEIFTNVENIESNAVIHSVGYPFSYSSGQNYMWIVNYPLDLYARIVFTNISLGNEGCHAKLFISKRISTKSSGKLINYTYNDRVCVIETEESLLFLTFTTCLGHEGGLTDRGFRAIVTGETIPACFSIDRNDGDIRSETCTRQAMIITSLSILNLPFVSNNEEESWAISVDVRLHYTLQLQFLDFYIRCPVLVVLGSRFVIVYEAEERQYCNTDKPPPVINFEGSNVIVKFQLFDPPVSVYLRKEGFRLQYSLIDHSLKNPTDDNNSSTVCSNTFGKCYHLESSLSTWDEASETCMKCNSMLVSIQSEYELQFLNYLLREFRDKSDISVPVNDTYKYQASWSSHIGAKQVNIQGKNVYVWENTAPVISFYWTRGNPVAGKACVRTNFRFLSNRTWESEYCSTDLSWFFVCQTPITEEAGLNLCKKSTYENMDIAFLIDTSTSVRHHGFHQMLLFIRTFVRKLNIGPDATQIAVLTFSADVIIQFNFKDVKSLSAAEEQIKQMKYRYGLTNTQLALKEMRLRLFSPQNGARNYVPKIAILMTDGVSYQHKETVKEAELAKKDGIRLVAVGIGSDVDDAKLHDVVSKPAKENYIHIDTFSYLDSDLLLILLRQISQMGKCDDAAWAKWKPLKNLNRTFSGASCRNWNNLSATEDHNLKTRFPNYVRTEKMYNFCQDPDSSGVLWCYTPDIQRLWEPCFIQFSSLETQDKRASQEERHYIFECDDGGNVSMFQRCDGVFNCIDSTDEIDCSNRAQNITRDAEISLTGDHPKIQERASLFHCDSKEWISVLAKCDNVIDCADASDELNCLPNNKGESADDFFCVNPECQVCDYITSEEQLHECDYDEYECENKQCISTKQRCDGIRDCLDGTDEKQCDCRKWSIHCDVDKCIPYDFLCDNYTDCDDGSDEKYCHGLSCEEWFERRGYNNSGYYLIDDDFNVYCDFTTVNSGKIKTVFQNIDVDLYKGKGLLYANDKFTNFNGTEIEYVFSNNTYCFLEVEETCQFPVMISNIDSCAESDSCPDCRCTIRRFTLGASDHSITRKLRYKDNSFVPINGLDCAKYDSFTDTNTSYYNVTSNGELYVDEKILKGEVSVQITPQQIVCTLANQTAVPSCGEYYNEHLSECIYVVDIVGYSEGCRSGRHLQNCGDFICPRGTVKCPGSYCIPLMFVCDGISQCPSGEDEYECTCVDEPREVLLFAEDTKESKFVARKIAKQFYTSGSDIRLLYFKTKTPLANFDVDHRLLEIREEYIYLYKILYHSNDCRFKSMARNVLQHITFSKYNITGIVFIENSLESSKVAELMFSNISNPGFTIYRVFKHASFTTNYYKPDKYRFVKDVPTHRWNALFYIGYRRFPEICEAATEVPCSGGYRCSSSKQCISLKQVCDGDAQCPEKDDERLCDYKCPNGCKCTGYSLNCRAAYLELNDTKALLSGTTVADFSQNLKLMSVLEESNLVFLSMTKLNLSSCGIEIVNKDGFDALRHLRCLDISYNRIKELQAKVFSKLEYLVYLNLDGNTELQIISPSAFHGLKHIRNLRITGTKLRKISSYTFSNLALHFLDISYNEISEIEDFAFNGSSVENIDCEGNTIIIFNQFMFEGVSSLQELRTPKFKFCCIRPCYLDEENCFPLRNEFSSCGDLMRHPVLQAMLWIVGSISLLGNFGSILYRILYDRERLKIGYGIFVTNLAGADFLMGIYLIMIAVADLVFRNRYIYLDDMWRNSNWCLTAGILSTVSSEASVLFVCLITLDRLLVIKYPFGTVRFEPKKAYLSCIVSWAVAFLIAIIPVMYTDYFENSFYSRSPVCIALPLTRDKPPGWIYSVSIFVGLNFCTFVLVAFGQLSIFVELRKATVGIQQTQKSRKRDLQVARNLIFVATTDFLCWFPIGLMGIMALNGYPIPGDVYAWTAVFILPLNSALNPILYTVTAILGKRSFNPNVEEQNRTDTLKESASAVTQYHYLLKLKIKNGKAPVGQNLADLLKRNARLSPAMLLSIAVHLSKYMCFLHDHCVYIEQMSTDSIYLKVDKKTRRCTQIYLDSKLTVSNDEKRLPHNIFQFGQLLRKLSPSQKARASHI